VWGGGSAYYPVSPRLSLGAACLAQLTWGKRDLSFFLSTLDGVLFLRLDPFVSLFFLLKSIGIYMAEPHHFGGAGAVKPCGAGSDGSGPEIDVNCNMD
jgi:hypothetical protein